MSAEADNRFPEDPDFRSGPRTATYARGPMSIRSYSVSDTVQVFCSPQAERRGYAGLGLLLLAFYPLSFWLLCLSPSAQHNSL